MGLKVVNVFLLIALSACLIQTAFGKPKPRDSSVVKDQSVVPIHNEALSPKEDITPKSEALSPKEDITPKSEALSPKEDILPKSEASTNAEYRIPGRVSCDYEEATEDVVCQEHCLPKGYTYGICVSHTCSCI